jgi:transcriptional regulator of acetoin/glycerol metabolism
LFLDEIGEMPLALQARLLRVLQEREIVPLGGAKGTPVDFVLVSATNRKLLDRVEQGLFREDLYYRINGLRVTLPALRQRSDLALLVSRILQEEADRPVALHADTLEMLQRHPWRGNVRQLRNVLRAALAFADDEPAIEPHHLPEDFMEELGKLGVPEYLPLIRSGREPSDAETGRIREAIRVHGGNMTEAARHLGIARATLYRRIKQLQVHL